MPRLLPATAGLVVLAGCGAPEALAPPEPSRPSVELWPPAELDHAPPAFWARVAGLGGSPEAVFLIDGAVSPYHAGKLRTGELPPALVERVVPARAWSDVATGELVLAPSRWLAPGDVVTVAALGPGPLAVITVAGDAGDPRATRIWPPRGAPGARRWVYCGAALGEEVAEVGLGATTAVAVARRGADGAGAAADHCFRLELPDTPAPAVLVPPPAIGVVALDPAPLVVSPEVTPAPTTCEDGEEPLALACARIQDDRALVRSDAPVLVTLARAGGDVADPCSPSSPLVLRGLPPDADVELAGAITSLGGREVPFSRTARTARAMPHVVINEVLANPAGPEATSEWVELYNDGAEPVEVSGFTLVDPAGGAALPRGRLAPGEFALVVPEGFVAAGGADVAPAAGTLLLRVPRLGTAGLSNAGEVLTLAGERGVALSRFPALPSSKGGVSLARRTPWAPDADSSAFGPSGAPGATPGWANDRAAP